MTAFKYYLGLDMGTNSVGWAATDPEYRLLKAKGKDLWGIREFNEASGAVERRTHRISRRRRQREQVRIGILKDYFHDAICEVDPSFFQRLENSKYHEEDKDVEVRYKNNIFNDSNYTDKDYFNEYPTIYHLRNELISSTEKHDVRLVFLALLNMFKHRGHFLNAGLGENNGESNIDNVYFELTELLSELTEYHLSQDIDCKQIEAILSRRDMSRTHKAEELAGVLHVDLKNKPYKELIRGLCGLKFNACVVFPDVQSEEVTKLDICLSESTFDEKSDEIANIIGEDYFEIIMAMKEMFDIGSLASIMKGHNYLSQARVASYTKHKEDLKLLKEVIKKYCGKKEYDKFFNSDADGSYHLAYRNILEELWKQYKGETGNFILSDGDKELKMSQRIECIYNIFNINTNDRKIISKLYQELTYQNDALLQEESIRFKQELMEYFDKLISTVPYNLKYNFEVDLSSLMKAISVETDVECDSLLEKMLQYIKLMNQICGIDIFVIPNLKYYFSTEETMQFYQFAMYNKIYIVVIEPTLSPHMEGEKSWIIDDDLCIIEL